MKAMLRKTGYVFGAMLSVAVWVPQAGAAGDTDVSVCDGVPVPTTAGGCIGLGPAGNCRGNSNNNVGICVVPTGCIMHGGAGNDLLFSVATIPFVGANLICGGTGGDLIAGGDADDTLLGQSGNDALVGGPAFPPTSFTVDLLDGGPGSDIAIGDSPFFQGNIDVGDTCISADTQFSCL